MTSNRKRIRPYTASSATLKAPGALRNAATFEARHMSSQTQQQKEDISYPALAKVQPGADRTTFESDPNGTELKTPGSPPQLTPIVFCPVPLLCHRLLYLCASRCSCHSPSLLYQSCWWGEGENALSLSPIHHRARKPLTKLCKPQDGGYHFTHKENPGPEKVAKLETEPRCPAHPIPTPGSLGD